MRNNKAIIDRTPSLSETRKPSILMIVENNFPADIRVKREAEALQKVYDVTVIALADGTEKRRDNIDGIEVFRIPRVNVTNFSFHFRFLERFFGKGGYVFQYLYLTILSGSIFLITHIKRRYKVIHANNPPDTLFLVGLLGKILSVKFVYDHHDLSPELYLTRFSKKKGLLFRVLVALEKASCRLADVVITTNESYKRIEIVRHHVNPDKIFVVRNDPSIAEFSCQDGDQSTVASDKGGKQMLLFVGCVNPQDGLDLLLRSIYYLVNDLNEKNIFCCVVGDGDALPRMRQITEELGLNEYLDFKGRIFDRKKIREYLCQADICVEPAPENPLNNYSTFIKIMEYMAAGKPIVAFDLIETKYSADGSAILVPPNDTRLFAQGIKQLLNDRNLRAKLGKTGAERVSTTFNWETTSMRLLDAYNALWRK